MTARRVVCGAELRTWALELRELTEDIGGTSMQRIALLNAAQHLEDIAAVRDLEQRAQAQP